MFRIWTCGFGSGSRSDNKGLMIDDYGGNWNCTLDGC
jgi:hypothetical protein